MVKLKYGINEELATASLPLFGGMIFMEAFALLDWGKGVTLLEMFVRQFGIVLILVGLIMLLSRPLLKCYVTEKGSTITYRNSLLQQKYTVCVNENFLQLGDSYFFQDSSDMEIFREFETSNLKVGSKLYLCKYLEQFIDLK